MSIKIDEIIIYLDLKINNEKEKENENENENEKKKLKSSLIYIPDPKIKVSLNDNPYITSSVKYDSLNMNSIFLEDYSNIVSFFFNKDIFKDKLSFLTSIKGLNITESKDKNDIIQSNITFMLNNLFPTTFPSKNGVVSTYDRFILNKSSSQNIFNNIFKNKYSYLKFDSKIYTISKIYILDDMLNNPFYKNIIDSYINFSRNSEEQKKNIKDKVIDKFKITIRNMNTNTESKKIYDISETNKKDKNNLNIIKYLSDNINDNIINNNRIKYEDLKKNIKKDKTIVGFKLAIELNKLNAKNYIGRSSLSNIESMIKNLEIIEKNLTEISKIQTNLISKMDNFDKRTDKTIEDIYFNDNIFDEIDTMYSYIKNIYDSYEKISSISNTSTEIDNDIEKDFRDKIKKLNEYFTEMYYYKKLYTQYLDKSTTTSLNLSNEDDKNFIDFVNKNYPTINKFIEKLKTYIVEKRKSSNIELQEIIQNFYEKKQNYENYIKNNNENNKISFSELINIINEELIQVKKTNFFNNESNKKYLNIGFNLININNNDLPQYEIIIAVDLLEGEYNKDNINTIKCDYRALLLGQKLENRDYKDSKYNLFRNRIFVPKPIGNIKEKNQENAKKKLQKNPIIEKKKGGNKKTKKNKSYKNKSKKII